MCSNILKSLCCLLHPPESSDDPTWSGVKAQKLTFEMQKKIDCNTVLAPSQTVGDPKSLIYNQSV